MTEPLSRLWYAANILALIYVYRDDFKAGYLYGEYRQRLWSEADILRSKKVQSSAMKGGHKRAAQSASVRGAVIECMQGYIKAGHTVANAARLAAKNGVGPSPSSNRQTWYRNRKV